MSHSLPETKPVSILVVDDDDVDVMGIERAFQKLNLNNPIIRARDGVEALSLLRQEGVIDKPYLILLDINMPVMNGIEFLTTLRADLLLRDAIVFILTTSHNRQDMSAAYDQHVAGYIVKKQIDDGFARVAEMLDHYWRAVELPLSKES